MKVRRTASVLFVLFICFLLLVSCDSFFAPADAPAVIFIIGDGMGENHIDAASIYLEGKKDALTFSDFPVQGMIRTHSADSTVTDSAAAATAFATGHKVNNGVLSLELPGSGSSLPTILEYFQSRGLKTGAVTTTAVTHATPAAFLSHVEDRNQYEAIAYQYFNITQPTLIIGGGGASYGITEGRVTGGGYTLLSSLTQPLPAGKLAYIRGEGHLPYEYDIDSSEIGLSDMTDAALSVLEEEPGFFLLIEGGRIDHAAHSNDLKRVIGEVEELNRTVDLILSWASSRSNVTVIVTADHETGGLATSGGGKDTYPEATWSTGGHTSSSVPFFVWGKDAEKFSSVEDNTEFYEILLSLFD